VAAFESLSIDSTHLLQYLSRQRTDARRKSVVVPGLTELTTPDTFGAACEALRRLLVDGGYWGKGKLRASGRHSSSWKLDTAAPSVSKSVDKREEEWILIQRLKVAWRSAAPSGYEHAKPAPRTVNPNNPSPFWRFVQECVKLLGSDANVYSIVVDRTRSDRPRP
jgi:hypothetical protein